MTRSTLVFGFAFVGLGVVLLLDRGGVVDVGETLARWWPLVVMVIGSSHLLVRPRHVAAGVFMVIVGGALLLWSLFGIDTVSLLWPLLLVGVGLWLLTRRADGPRPTATAQVTTDDDLVALFDDRAVRVPAGPLSPRSATTILGDLALDLREATLVTRTKLQVVTIFGDVVVDVPDTWLVTTSGPQIFGSVRVAPATERGATQGGLHLEVVTIFGDVSVRRSTPDRPGQDLPA